MDQIINNSKIKIIFLIVLAATPRLFFLDLIEFKYDEALSVFTTNLFYHQPYLPQIGMLASTGMYNFPLFNYLLIILGLFSRQPQYLSFLIAFINVIAILLFYKLNKRIFGESVAFISALILSISPWAVLFSRKVWAQDLLLIFAVPFYYLLINFIESKQTKHPVLLFFLLLILIQLHASGIFLAITVVILLIFLKIKVNMKKALLGCALSLIFAVPFIFFELASTPFCRDCAAFFNYQAMNRPFDFWNFIRSLQIINGSYFQYILGPDYDKFINFNPLILPITYVFILECFLIFIGTIYLAIRIKRKYVYLPVTLLIISFLYFITRTPSFMHYFVIILPVIAIIYALTFCTFYKLKKNTFYRTGIILLFLLFFFSKCFFILEFFQFISQKQNILGDYGHVFKLTEKAVNQETQQYRLLPQYEDIKQYSYIFINTTVFHQKLADYFIALNYLNLAITEYKWAVLDNPKDTYSLGNLAYLYIQDSNFEESKKQIDRLTALDPSLSEKLQKILNEKQPAPK